jgi:general stress protein 26
LPKQNGSLRGESSGPLCVKRRNNEDEREKYVPGEGNDEGYRLLLSYSRPMSNNRNVEYNGENYFFSYSDNDVCREIQKDPAVSLSFSVPGEMIFISVGGKAELLHDRELMKKYWDDELEQYFPDGINQEGIVLIKVKAELITLWEGNEESFIIPGED